jgi:hypothetical protein
MITVSDSHSTFDLGKYFAIVAPGTIGYEEQFRSFQAAKVKVGFSYNSLDNETFLSVTQIRSLIKRHIDVEFEPV